MMQFAEARPVGPQSVNEHDTWLGLHKMPPYSTFIVATVLSIAFPSLPGLSSITTRPTGTPSSVRFSAHPLADERRAVLQDDALPLGREEETNRIDVGQSQLVEVQHRRSAIRSDLRAPMLDVFRPHAADQADRGPVFADVGDDPERHLRREPKRAGGLCNGQTGSPPIEANDLQDRDVLNRQNVLIRRHFDGPEARVSDSCTDACRFQAR
jgi:hypothetical protein